MVDDDPELRAITKDALAYHGITLGAAKDGDEAIKMLKASTRMPYDAVLLDLGLPGKSGLDTLRVIRSDLKSPIPVIIVTGHAEKEIASELAKLTISGFLVKPYDPATLVERIIKIVGSTAKAA